MSLSSLGATSTAGNEDQNSGDQVQDGSDENAPNGRTPSSDDVAGAARVDSVLDDAKGSKVTGHGDEGNDKGQEGEERGDEGTDEAGAQAEQKGQKGEAGGDGVQNQYPRKNPGAITVGLGERDLSSLSQGSGGIISHVRGCAGIRTTGCCQSSLLTRSSRGAERWESIYLEWIIQYPNVPYVILSTALRPPKSTFKMERSLTTGAVTDTTIRSAVAASSRTVPMWWKKVPTPMMKD